MGDLIEGLLALSGLPAQLGQVEVAARGQRAPSVLLGERQRLVQVLFRHSELRRVRSDGGQTDEVVGDELPAPFAAFVGPVEDLSGEASGFLVRISAVACRPATCSRSRPTPSKSMR